MNLYLWPELDHVSDNYHSKGGLVVVARDKTHAMELVANDDSIDIPEDAWAAVVSYTVDYNSEPAVYVFPNAGCC